MNNTALGAENQKEQTINFISEVHEKFYYEKLKEVMQENFCRKNTVQNHHLVHRLEMPYLLHVPALLPLRMANLRCV